MCGTILLALHHDFQKTPKHFVDGSPVGIQFRISD